MADDLDRASDLEQLQRDIALKRQSIKSGMDQPSRHTCIDCEAPIPERRRALGGVLRCFDCAWLDEIRNARNGRR